MEATKKMIVGFSQLAGGNLEFEGVCTLVELLGGEMERLNSPTIDKFDEDGDLIEWEYDHSPNACYKDINGDETDLTNEMVKTGIGSYWMDNKRCYTTYIDELSEKELDLIIKVAKSGKWGAEEAKMVLEELGEDYE